MRFPSALHIRRHLPWLLVALPALGQLWLLCVAVWGRFFYPFDLEWMEGGMLAHAQRIVDGAGLYNEPSVEFIPFLYTPLYPTLMAWLEPVFGITYQLARAFSVLSLIAVVIILQLAIVKRVHREHRVAGAIGALLAAALMAATYPWVEGWYDIARADTLFLAMVMGGLTYLMACARTGHGWTGHARVGVAASILALSFFCKQTGVLYVAAGGCILLVMNWRRLPVYVAVAGVIGLGGTAISNHVTDGWFWTYIFEVHQAHDTNMTRFWLSFEHILWHFPAMTAVIAFGLVCVSGAWLGTRERPPSTAPLIAWTFIFAVSCLVGALGWATQWAHFNAYIPAMVTGAAAAGAAIPAIMGAVTSVLSKRGLPSWPGTVAGWLIAVVLGAQLWVAWWNPNQFIPAERDVIAGHRLIEQIRSIEGEVFIPFHPWYAHLAGKRVFTHRMGVMDVSYVHPKKHRKRSAPPPWPVAGMNDAFRDTRFAAIIWDNRPVDHYMSRMKQTYRMDDFLSRDAQPRLFTGAKVHPKEIWIPSGPTQAPPGARVLWNFDNGTFEGWNADGAAFGRRPRNAPLRGQGRVRQYGGLYYVTSMHGGDKSTGTLTSPAFTITGSRISVRVSGGNHPKTLRVELHVGDTIAYAVTGRNDERMRVVDDWDVSEYRGQVARIVLVDEEIGSWGHLSVDEIWQWQ